MSVKDFILTHGLNCIEAAYMVRRMDVVTSILNECVYYMSPRIRRKRSVTQRLFERAVDHFDIKTVQTLVDCGYMLELDMTAPQYDIFSDIVTSTGTRSKIIYAHVIRSGTFRGKSFADLHHTPDILQEFKVFLSRLKPSRLQYLCKTWPQVSDVATTDIVRTRSRRPDALQMSRVLIVRLCDIKTSQTLLFKSKRVVIAYDADDLYDDLSENIVNYLHDHLYAEDMQRYECVKVSMSMRVCVIRSNARAEVVSEVLQSSTLQTLHAPILIIYAHKRGTDDVPTVTSVFNDVPTVTSAILQYTVGLYMRDDSMALISSVPQHYIIWYHLMKIVTPQKVIDACPYTIKPIIELLQ